MIRFLILFLLICGNAFASTVVCWDEVASPNNVDEYARSAHTPLYEGRADCLINPAIGFLASVPRYYWVHDAGAIREMTTLEKADYDQAQLDALTLSIRSQAYDSIDALGEPGMRLRGALLVILDEVNILRNQHGLTPRTASQIKTAIKNKINAGEAD